MEPSSDGCKNNSPIKIVGEVKISYEIVSDYMMECRRVAYVDEDVAKDYLKESNKSSEINEDVLVAGGQVRVKIQQSSAQYEGIRSAVAYLYKRARVDMPSTMQRDFKSFISGQRCTGLKEKQSLGLQITEGKKALSIQAYELIAKYLFYSGTKENVFGNLFYVLDCCLMKRAENCVHMKLNHIYFTDDSLVFEFAKSKGYQKGESHVGPWHVYANPQKPWLCPVLSLSRYIICYPDFFFFRNIEITILYLKNKK